MKRYRIRVGKAHFADPHYVTALGDSLNYTSIVVNRNPRSWKKLSVAQKHLAQIQERLTGAEIEEYEA